QGHPDDPDGLRSPRFQHPLAEREPARRLRSTRRRGRGRALQGVRQALDGGRLAVDEPRMPEPPHLGDDRQQSLALGRQFVLDTRWRLREAAPLDDPLVLEDAQPLGERPRADPGARVLELGEAPGPLGKIVDEQRGPLGADDLGTRRYGAALVVNWPHRAHFVRNLTLPTRRSWERARAGTRLRSASG